MQPEELIKKILMEIRLKEGAPQVLESVILLDVFIVQLN